MEQWKQYKNGNCITSINLENGTKIHETINPDDKEFKFDFSESCDLNITDYCDGGCNWCLIAGTKILMGDYSYKNIEDVKIGDIIIGYEENSLGNGKQRKIIKSKVTKTFVHVESELYNVETKSGLKITTTPNHPFLAEGRGKNHSRKYSKIQDIKIGKYLFSIQLPYLKEIDYNSKDYKLGYMIGAWAGDGTRCSSVTKDGYSKFLCRFVTKDKEINEMVMNCTSEFIDGFYWNDFNMHGFVIPAVTNASKNAFDKLNKLFDDSIGNISTLEYAAGFTAGMYDTEGSIGVERCNIRIANTNLIYLDEIQRCLSILDIENIREVAKDIKKYSRGYKPIYNIRIRGKYQWNNFLWLTRPCCSRKNLDNNISQSMAYGKDELIRKDKIYNMQYVYNLETECHTYIANNILVHNCYQGCTLKGKHANLDGVKFFDTLHPYTELAINGNDLSHPQLLFFLEKMKEKNIIVSMTVNQKHFMKNIDFIKYLLDNKLIKGLGVSLVYPNKEFINEVKNFPTAVIHTIAGIITKNELDKLANNDLKILILGYKTMKNRGKDYYENGHKEEIDEKIEWLSNNLGSYLNKFKVVSFDNLCTKQLNVKNIIGEERWKECYMGDDGTHTFYIDLVKKKFARTSISEEQYDLLDNIDDMFKIIREESINNDR